MEIKAGPELDALVAEKVMGLAKCWHWTDGSGSLSVVHGDACDAPIPLQCHDAQLGRWTKRYSTDIGAAWEVLEKLKLMADGDIHIECLDDQWGVSSCYENDCWKDFECADSAPLAICLAALKIVEKGETK